MKPKGAVHNYFIEKSVSNKKQHVCLYCGTSYQQRNATRMKDHILKCSQCPIDIKKKFGYITSPQPGPTRTIKKNTSNKLRKSINSLIARAVYVTAMPLATLEHPLWQKVFDTLRPGYAPPTRKQLATSLLDLEYETMKNEVEEIFNNSSCLHLAADGWSNINNDSVINLVIYTPKPLFYTFIETKQNRHTAEYLLEKISCIIDKLGAKKFTAVVSDNAANMVKCGKLLEERYSHILWNGCMAHTLHLHISDILKMKDIADFFADVIGIIKAVKYSHIMKAAFKAISEEKKVTVSLHLPVKTRWGSYSQCLETFLISKIVLQNLCINENVDNKLSREQKRNILDVDYWQRVTWIRDFLNPITTWISKLEGDYGSLHNVYHCVKEINQSLTEDFIGNILDQVSVKALKEKFDSRQKTVLKPIHFAACILNPNDKGRILTEEEYINGCELLTTFAGQTFNRSSDTSVILEELSSYKNKRGIWSKSFLYESSEKMEPATWWNTFFPETKLGKIADRILTVPATSAAVERSFSTFGGIHTIKRNRLLTERAGKITFIVHNWKTLNKDIIANDYSLEHPEASDNIIQEGQSAVVSDDFTSSSSSTSPVTIGSYTSRSVSSDISINEFEMRLRNSSPES